MAEGVRMNNLQVRKRITYSMQMDLLGALVALDGSAHLVDVMEVSGLNHNYARVAIRMMDESGLVAA